MDTQVEKAKVNLELSFQKKDTQIRKLQDQFLLDNTNWSIQSQLSNLQEQLLHLDLARERIKKGVYGVCQTCKMPINPKRLMLVPDAENCVHCNNKIVKTQFHNHKLSPAYI